MEQIHERANMTLGRSGSENVRTYACDMFMHVLHKSQFCIASRYYMRSSLSTQVGASVCAKKEMKAMNVIAIIITEFYEGCRNSKTHYDMYEYSRDL